MTELSLPNGKTLLVVEVPKDADYHLSETLESGDWISINGERKWNLPEGNYSILGKLSELTTDQCEPFVEREWDGTAYWYMNYMNLGTMIKRDPIKSLNSFFQFKGLDLSKEYLILIKLNSNE